MAGKKIDRNSMTKMSGGNTVGNGPVDMKNAKAVVKEELKKEALAKAQGAGMARHKTPPSGRVLPANGGFKNVDAVPGSLPICTGAPEPIE